MPALMCTTVPPAKSMAPNAATQPIGLHTQCAIGAYTTIDHSTMKMHMAENFMRSAKAPAISAGVMIANVIWNIMYTVSGMVVTVGFAEPRPKGEADVAALGNVGADAVQHDARQVADIGRARW